MSKNREKHFEKGTVIRRCREDRIFDAVIFVILTLIIRTKSFTEGRSSFRSYCWHLVQYGWPQTTSMKQIKTSAGKMQILNSFIVAFNFWWAY